MGRLVRVFLVVALLGAVAPTVASPATLPASASPLVVPHTAGQPATPPSGHFHALAEPRRLASTLTGVGMPKQKVPAGATRTIVVAGKAGLPASGVRAVAVTFTVVSPAGSTALFAKALAPKPAVPVLSSPGRTASAFAVVPVSSDGRFLVWNGAHATDMAVDVTGWFSGANESGTAGLFNRLAGRSVESTALAANATQQIVVRGREDVPAAGASTLLLRVRTAGAQAAGSLGVGPTSASTGAVLSMAYTTGAGSDLVVARLNPAGALFVRNRGAKPVTVTLDAIGWFTNGASSQQFGDVLRLSSASGEVLHATVTTSGVIPIVAGVRGIPSESTTAPSSLVLLRTIAANPTSAGALTVDPWGATPAGSPALATRASTSVAGLVLAPPGSTNRARVAMRAGSAVVTAEAYAWFAGGVVVAAGTHILTGAAVTAVKTVLPDSVTFTGQPDALADLAVGDVVVAGVAAKTPVGLLRKVSAIDRTGTDLVVTTTDASLTDAVTQGALSAGTTNASSLAAPHTASAKASTNALAAPHAGDTSCDIGGSLFFGGATVGCSHEFGPGADEWQVSLGSSATAAMGIAISIGWGVPPKIDATTSLQVSTSTTASVTAHLHADLDETYPMGKKQWAPIDIQLGPVPVVIVPEAEASLHVTGTVEETLSGIATFGASLGVVCEAGGSCTTTHDSGGSAGGSYQHTFHANVKAAFEPKISALLYDVAGLTATLSPYVSADADACTLTFKSGVDLVVGIALAPLGETIAEANATIPLVETTLAQMPLRNCAIWSGSFNFSAHLNYDNGLGYTHDINGSSSMTIDPVGDVPPQFDIYPMSGSGSGADIQHDTWQCGHPPTSKQTDDISNWAGDITTTGGPLTVHIASAGTNQWLAELYPNGRTSVAVPGTHDVKVWGEDLFGACYEITDHSSFTDWWSDVFALFEDSDGAPGDQVYFTLAPGQMSASGHRELAGGVNSPGYTLDFNLTKRCSMGGTNC